MPTLLETEVRPGDVISSELFQAMIAKLAELDGRVAELEGDTGSGPGTGAPQILGTIPATQQRVGLDLELTGVNFALPSSANQVTVDAVPVTQFLSGSNTTRLRFIIPTGVQVPPAGRNVEIRVTNSGGSHAILFRVLPAIQAPPTPVIDSVENADTPGAVPQMGGFILINGSNFAPNPAENQIIFEVTTAGGTFTYPRAGESIEIDTGASGTTQIRARMPVIDEVPSGAQGPVRLEIRVGASAPGDLTFLAARP